MSAHYFIGLDIHKKMIAYCVKTLDGRLVDQGMVNADRKSLHEWAVGLPGPWVSINRGQTTVSIRIKAIHVFLWLLLWLLLA